MLPLPNQPETPNVRRLAQYRQEEQTGVTGFTLAVDEQIVEGWEAIYKNGLRLRRGVDYTLAGGTVTLAVAAIAGDVWQLDYYFR